MRVFILLLLLVNFSLFSQNNIDEKEVEKLFLNLVNPDSFKSHLKELTKYYNLVLKDINYVCNKDSLQEKFELIRTF